MMLHFTDEERMLFDIIHETNGIKSTKEEQEKALKKFRELFAEKKRRIPFLQDDFESD